MSLIWYCLVCSRSYFWYCRPCYVADCVNYFDLAIWRCWTIFICSFNSCGVNNLWRPLNGSVCPFQMLVRNLGIAPLTSSSIGPFCFSLAAFKNTHLSRAIFSTQIYWWFFTSFIEIWVLGECYHLFCLSSYVKVKTLAIVQKGHWLNLYSH